MGVRSEQHRRAATRAILRWYRTHGRILPWRNIRDPYRVLIAEIMLHQTQVSRVLKIFPRFLRRFPSLRSLASARQSDVVIAWKGMGYNNRAVRIHHLARQLVSQHRGTIPETVEGCLGLPGIGKYTAHALLVSVYHLDLPVVDVNIRRVLSRLFWRMRTTEEVRPDEALWSFAAALVPPDRAYEWAQALMDLGATVCTARAPRCLSCPVAEICPSGMRMKFVSPGRNQPPRPRAGIPDRIYRGKIIDALRSSRRGLTLRQVRSAISRNNSRNRTLRLPLLISALERDGLIRVQGKRSHWETRIRLA